MAWFSCWNGCAYCASPDKSTADHVVPISRGGAKRSIENLLPACAECNQLKADMDPEAWLEMIDQDMFSLRLVMATARFDRMPESSNALRLSPDRARKRNRKLLAEDEAFKRLAYWVERCRA